MAELIRFPWEELQDAADLTPFVERVERLEDLCGVKIGGISAYYEGENAVGHHVKILAEATGFGGIGHVLAATVVVQCVGYDGAGRVVAVCRETLWQSDFRGLHPLDFDMFSKTKPERFVIYPRK